MASYRIYQEDLLPPHGKAELHPEAAHHLSRVLRARVDDKVVLFNGDGYEYHGIITEITKNKVLVNITEKTGASRESHLTIELAQGISRSDRMDLTLQKAVELGVTHITPLITERVNIKQDKSLLEKKYQHWQRIIISACEQCGRNTIPILKVPQLFHSWLENLESSLYLLLDPNSTVSLKQCSPTNDHVTLLIGPEGGLSSAEVDFAVSKGFTAVSLGPRILRTETAAIAALTLAQGLWGDI